MPMKADSHGKAPAAFEQLDHGIGNWKEELKGCSQWSHRKTPARSTTLDDYFSHQGPSNSFKSNFRLIGRQKKILPSDPRWDWVNIARKKQQRVGSGIRDRSTGSSALDFSNRHGSVHAVHEVRSANVSSRDDSISVQAQRMHLRDKRFRAPSKQQRPRESFFARSGPQPARQSSQAVYPPGISFDDVTPEKRLRSAEVVNPTIHSSNSKQQAVNWETIFEVVVGGPSTSTDEDAIAAISRQGQEALLAFGHPICGPLSPPHLFSDEEYEFEDGDSFRAIVTRRTSRLRQLVNDLRLQESTFMDSLSRGGLGAVDEEGFASTPEWILLVSLEEAYHRAIASLAVQLLQALEGVSPSALPSCLKVILEESAALIRQLPDCDSLFNGCKAYFFFFEVASRDATTTPLLTAVSRTYWYCLNLLVALRPVSDRLVRSHGTAKQEIEDVLITLPVNRFILGVVLFLFDLYIYLPSSHRAEDKGIDGLPSGSPALSLWMLVRGCCASSAGVDQSDHEPLSMKEKHFWALLQAVYRQRYFDELARCFVRSESCGGYLRDFEPNAMDAGKTEDCDEVFESQLLALEATWDLLAVLTRIYAEPDDDKHEEAVCDAKWAVVKDLLQPGKLNFLPFNLSPSQSTNPQSDYRHHANLYKQHVLKRITTFSKQWLPSKEVVELILRQLWGNDVPHHPDDIVELPHLLKQFTSRCKELGNARLRLAAFVGEHNDDGDTTTSLCKIIWVKTELYALNEFSVLKVRFDFDDVQIQLLKLEKRVHRSRFRRSVLNAIPDTPDKEQVPTGNLVYIQFNDLRYHCNDLLSVLESKSNLDDRRQRLQSAAMSPLYQMRDLVRKMLEMPSSGMRVGPAFGPAVGKSLEHIFSAGMMACLNAATYKIMTASDLKIAMEIFQLVLPRAPDEPKQCFATPGGFDNDLDDALAEVDMESLLAGRGSRPAPAWTVKECRPKVVQLITSNLRAVQQLVLNYPSSDAPTFDELYAIDLLGMVISTCTVQFFWNNVTSTADKSRNLAPRVLGAALKYSPEKEWLRNIFLRECGSDQELSIAWLLGTLDVAALNSTPIEFKLEDVPSW
ncbi:hypothetical protein GQ600_15022 [Phytophthora cactorum]|nr:hypothetical protein GQ600_15022 [Phytophthora cactorum]